VVSRSASWIGATHSALWGNDCAWQESIDLYTELGNIINGLIAHASSLGMVNPVLREKRVLHYCTSIVTDFTC